MHHDSGARNRTAVRARLPIAAVLALIAGLIPLGTAHAAPSQNEMVMTSVYDGTSTFTPVDAANPANGGATNPATHTPSFDSGANNGVVRTWDLFALRVDWDVNEAASTATTLTVTLNRPSKAAADVSWAPDNTGMFAGCGPGSSISASGLVLTCVLGDLEQGSHGVIRPIAQLKSGVDNTLITVSATMTDASGATPVSSNLARPYTVSESPSGDWVKNAPVVTPTPVTVGGQSGYVALFPIGLKSEAATSAPTKGAGPVGAGPITFQDHAWDLPTGSTVATPAQIAAANVAGTKIYGSPCGSYDVRNNGRFPVTGGTVSCAVDPAGTRYPVENMTFTIDTVNPAPTTNANATPNTGYIATGQLVMWLPAAPVQAEMTANGGIAEFHNTVSANPATDNLQVANPTVTPIKVPGTGTPNEAGVANNSVRFLIVTPGNGGGGSPGGGDDVSTHFTLLSGKFSILRSAITNNYIPSGELLRDSSTYFDGKGRVSRGSQIYMHLGVSIGSTAGRTDPVAGCLRWDPTQINIASFPSYQLTTVKNSVVIGRDTVGATGNYENLTMGHALAGGYRAGNYDFPSLVPFTDDELAQMNVAIEYGYDSDTFTDGVSQNSVECNNKAGRVWVDSKSTATLAAHAAQIDSVRIRVTGRVPWAASDTYFPDTGAGFYLVVAGKVGTDLAANPNGKSVYLHSSRAIGAWDPATQNKPPTTVCLAHRFDTGGYTRDRSLDTSPSPAGSGWCNLPYNPGNEQPATSVSTLDPGNFTYEGPVFNNNVVRPWDSDTDRVKIITASPLVEKINVAGPLDIKNNGQLVTYTMNLSLVGSDAEALGGVEFYDFMPDQYEFVSIDQPFSTPGVMDTCEIPPPGTTGATIFCQMSRADPTGPPGPNEADLPIGLPSDWTDSITITFRVKGGVASPANYAPIINTAALFTAYEGEWDPDTETFVDDPNAYDQVSWSDAYSYMPLPSDLGSIVKAMDRELGGCTKFPGAVLTGAALADWQKRCSLIALDHSASNMPATDSVGNLHFDLSYTNSGNTNLTNMRFVDVFPFVGDGSGEPASNSGANGASPSTAGDARSPASSFSGKVGYVSNTGATSTWVTSAAPATISRDPDKAATATTWCSAVGGTRVSGPPGSCPTSAYAVTAVFLKLPTVSPGNTVSARLNLDTESDACDDIWTNTFGARVNEINLPIRSNDVSIMSGCQSVGDFVWLDVNRNGLQDNDEPPLKDVTVKLYDDSNVLVDTTTTDASGYYTFQGVAPTQAYSIQFVAPVGMSLTTQDVSGITSNDPTTDNTAPPLAGTSATAGTHGDSDPSKATGRVSFTTGQGAGENKSSSPAAGTVADNPGFDAGFASINLELDKTLTTSGKIHPNGTVMFTLTPKNSGRSDALAGWSVTEQPPTGLTVTELSGTGYNCVLATLTCTSSQRLAAGDTGEVITVTATVAGNVTNQTTLTNQATVSPVSGDAVETSTTDNTDTADLTVERVASIGDYVWWDTNRNGQQDAGEDPVPDVTVNLYDSNGDLAGTTNTDAQGYYYFATLPLNTDFVVEFVKPEDTVFTTRRVGDVRTDSDPRPNGTVSVTTPTDGNNQTGHGQTDNPTIDAGLIKLNLSLAKSLKTTGTIGVGQTIEFELTPHNDGPADALAGWSVTDTLPNGLEYVDASGPGYTCTPNLAAQTVKCVAVAVLKKGDGPVVTVKAKVMSSAADQPENLGHIDTAANDIAETSTVDNDATATVDVERSSIGDYVWWDTNRNGQQDPTEQAVPDVVVNLYDANGTAIATTQTGPDGSYAFADLTPGLNYTVEFVKPANTDFTTQTTGAPATDSDADLTTGRVAATAPPAGQNLTTLGDADDPTIDAGLVQINLTLDKLFTDPAVVHPGDTVTFTVTPKNTGETDALAGWSVTEEPPTGMTVTDLSGSGYTCVLATLTCTSSNRLAAGAAGGMITVTATIALDVPNLESLENSATVHPAPGDAPESSTTDNSDTADLTVDRVVSIGDYVWWDDNRNGQQDTGEDPVPGVRVKLYAANGDFITSTVTDGQGYYFFSGLPLGTDLIVEFVKPGGTSFTERRTGDSHTDSDPAANGRVIITTPSDGSNATGHGQTDDPWIDAGLVKLNLSLTKTLTTTGTIGVGRTIEFELTPHNGGPSDALDGWSVTDVLPQGLEYVDASGPGYTCTPNLPAQTVTCVAAAVLEEGDGPIITVTAKVMSAAADRPVNAAHVDPASNDIAETTTADNDASATVTIERSSIGDYVWWDTNRNGQQDPGEDPVEHVIVNLYNAEGIAIASTETGPDGSYAFPDLTPGLIYTVEFMKPANTRFTTATTGDSATDSDANTVTGRVSVTAPPAGQNLTTLGDADDPTIDAGLVQVNLTVEKELTTTGRIKPGDTVTFTLTPKNIGKTDALAGWSVTDVLPTGLTVTDLTGDGYDCVLAAMTCSSSDPLAAGDTGGVITVTATVDSDVADQTTLTNIGLVTPADGEPESDTEDNSDTVDVLVERVVSIGDYVWWDTNRNGQQDAGEDPVARVLVNLYDRDGNLVGSVRTGVDGYYSFVDLRPDRDYVVELVKPAHTSFTDQRQGDPATDSDADPTTGRVSVRTPLGGTDLGTPDDADDPTIDAGLVQINLTLAKKLTTTGQIQVGDTVTYSLTPHNDGPVDALPGWSVTDLLPVGLEFVSGIGDGYTCSPDRTARSVECTNSSRIPPDSDGPVLTITARVTGKATGSVVNVAYVAPDPDDAAETDPLVIPGRGTDTTTTPTDNDSHASFRLGGGGASGGGGNHGGGGLPETGASGWLTWAVPVGAMMLLTGGGLVWGSRRRRTATE